MAYNAGHATAISRAIEGNLDGAYTLPITSWGTRFRRGICVHLVDSYTNPLRTSQLICVPRYEKTHLSVGMLRCRSQFMHDEDCAIRLKVSNIAGESWECYGDKRALDKAATENLMRCVAAVQASADEIYTAYLTGEAPPPSTYAAWRIAPTLESARSTSQVLAKLFTSESGRRQDIKKRRVWGFTTYLWFGSTAFECATSGYWNYPIVINGTHTVIPWSGISAVSPRTRSLRVFYQSPGGGILQSAHSDDLWTHLHDQPLVRAVPFTPLASVNWGDGKEVSCPLHFRYAA